MSLSIAMYLAMAALCVTAAPAEATGSGVVSSFSFQPSALAAGGNPDLTMDISFSYTGSDSLENAAITLPPGLIVSPASVPATCSSAQLAGSSCPSDAKIGSGTGTTNPSIGTAGIELYLMPAPAASDISGMGAILSEGGVSVSFSGAIDRESVGGQPVMVLKFTNVPNMVSGVPVQATSIHLTVNGVTSDGGHFTRMPTSCGLATVTLSVDTYAASADGGGTDSFTPTGCAAPPPPPKPKPTPTFLHLRSSASPAKTGKQVIYTARLTPVPDGGSLSFSDNGRPISGCQNLPVVAGGTATCKVTYKRAGSHTIQVRYGGDTHFATSTSNRLNQVIKRKHPKPHH